MDAQDDADSITAQTSRPIEEGAGATDVTASTPTGIRSSPPVLIHNVKTDADVPTRSPEDQAVKSDSEAETLILPGKDGHSPSKIRKSIKAEDKSEDEQLPNVPDKMTVDDGAAAKSRVSEVAREGASSKLGKRKRPKHGNDIDDADYAEASSDDSSILTSPIGTARSSLSKPAASDSESVKSPSPPVSVVRSKAKSVDNVLSRKKSRATGSGDEAERPKFNRQRSSGADPKPSKENRASAKPHADTHSRTRTRSVSPPARAHKRSISTTQLSASGTNGLSHKKKRVPAPLQSTEYHSDDSSASSGAHPRSSRLRSLAAPRTGELTASPAKMAPHKKHLDAHGQTLLARACSTGKLESARQRLAERPDDLNWPDFAGNTPLQVASLEGHVEIVKLLIEAGAQLDTYNDAKDTPLLDAVDNGHLEVIKLLLDAGVNPRKANVNGEEPLDRVNDDLDHADEIRELIIAAKQRSSEARRSSEDNQGHDTADSRQSHPMESPRHTPPVQIQDSHSYGFTSRRGASGRSTKTSDRVLYQPLDLQELRKACGQGDEGTVARILQVKDGLNDAKCLIVAAKGGHDNVINLLFGLGGFNPDPAPLESMPSESATPILAAIGRENLEVIKLILAQSEFDPTRTSGGKTYYEIARNRAGPMWREEEQLLKDAYEKYKKTHKSPVKPRSPKLRRDTDREARRQTLDDSSRSHKRTLSSPKEKESELRKPQNKATGLSKDGGLKRGPGRPKREDMNATNAVSDSETVPLGPPKPKAQAKKQDLDAGTVSSDTETVKPRRKLISAKELKGERERKRRSSITSTASTASLKDRPFPSDGKSDVKETKPNKPSLSRPLNNNSDIDFDKSKHDRARSLKRDDSKDRLSAVRGESPVKRHRTSSTPPHGTKSDTAAGSATGETPAKRRKFEGESKPIRKSESNPGSPPDSRQNKSNNPHKPSSNKATGDGSSKNPDTAQAKGTVKVDTESTIVASSRPSKSSQDVEMEDVSSKAEEERQAKIRREKEEDEAKQKRELEEKQEQERIEAAKQARLAREKQAREEEEKRLREEAERKERQRQEDAEAHKRAMEEQKRLYLEQQRIQREEQERRRAAREEQQRLERLKAEQQREEERLAKLPPLLRWFDQHSDPKTPEIASLFRYMEGFRYDTIRPEVTGQPNGRDQWLLNTQVALLLGEKDLTLSRYTAWERIPVSKLAKEAIWEFEGPKYSLTDERFKHIRQQFLEKGNPIYSLNDQAKPLFLDLDLFFVKVSEFMFVVPNFPHLRGLELVINYRELHETPVWPPRPGKWTQDPDYDPTMRYAPRPKYYINGEFERQGEIKRTRVSRTSFGENRLPRRGLKVVEPHEPDYEAICRAQGLRHLLPASQSTSPTAKQAVLVPNPILASAHVNGFTPPSSVKSINGGSPRLGSSSLETTESHGLPNGYVNSPKENGVPAETAQ
ncbi:ankyrin repeat protein [Xylogone sp. PMI_703]|nr:ankyrin repeat protein [Xylogone sp. PMI_703]